MGLYLALSAALAYGTSHFLGGMASRKGAATAVAVYGQLAGLAIVTVTAPFFAGDFTSVPGLGWGALSGVGTGLGATFLYRGLASGKMSIVSPLSEVAAVMLPVAIGITFGERPSLLALSGVAAALPAIWLISRGNASGTRTATKRQTSQRSSAAWLGLLAGAGFALQFIALAQVPEDTGLWPLVAGRVASSAIIATWIAAAGLSFRLPTGSVGMTAAAGTIGTAGSLLFMLATRDQLLALATALASLYPVIPVLAGYLLLREHISFAQVIGLVGAAVAVVLIVLG